MSKGNIQESYLRSHSHLEATDRDEVLVNYSTTISVIELSGHS